ncbi:MAG: HlyD family efflux transporter periplasmic adaptor subunit [Planctomycetaceae bacterium]|nr:HlyD family efflux transporter periplasmic adaptor subunit [Planctomycetaceae bacterium]
MTFPSHSESVARSASLLARADGLLEHAETLARTTIATGDYYRQVLGELADILEADSVAVWSARDDSVSLLFDTCRDLDRDRVAQAVELIGRLEADRTVLVPPGVGGRLPNAMEFARCIACVSVAPSLRLALDVRLPAAAQRGENISDVVAAAAAIVVEFHRGRQLERMFSLSVERDHVAALCQTLHTTLNRRRIALDLANEGAAALRVDRVSVLLAEESGFRLEAATSVNEINRRANASRAIEQLVFDVRRQGTALPWTSADEPPDAAKTYLQESGASRVRVEPLSAQPGSWDAASAAIVLESFSNTPLNPDFDGVAEVCRHAATALANAAAHESQGLRNRLLSWKALAPSRRTRTIAMSIVGVLLALILIPVDFELESRGQVQPARRRHIYAPADGVIRQVSVNNTAAVEEGATLAVMRNPDLDLEEQRIRGEIATSNARLAAIRATRVDHDRRSPTSTSAGQLAAEEEELKQTLASLSRQLEIVNRRVAELTLRSPIAGQVVRWDLIRSLESRPVRQGQLLMQVVDPAGPWQLELRIPDRHVRHVLAAQAAMKDANRLSVRFLFHMSPTTTYSATLDDVHLATDLDQDGELSTLAKVTLNPKDIPDLRPGSSVIAKIDCGRRSLGYVWLRELLEFLQTRVLF